jgi:NADPH2:quinone reductase
VEQAGEGVAEFHVGDRVCAILAGGGYAEFCAVPVEQALPIPENWTAVEAASLPENLFTAFDNMVTRGGLKATETVLIHGGSSGVGSMAILLARQLGANVAVTAGSDKKCQACLDLGAQHAINYKDSDFAAEVHKWTQGHGVDLILDMVGGAYLERNLKVLATEGRLVIIATQGGASAQLDLGALLRKRARVLGSTMRVRTVAEKGLVAAALRRDIWPLLPSKQGIRPVIDSVFDLADASTAHDRMESGEVIGKVFCE